MKKIFFSFLAIAAIASCAKTEAVYEGADSEIKLAPVAAKQTKATVLGAIDGTEYPTAENFDVYGYWKNVGAGKTYTDGQSYFGGAVEFTNKGNYWGGVTPYYWPKNGALRFAAYSPADLDLAHEQVGDVFSVDGYSQPSNTAETWDFLVAPTSESYTAMTAAENVSVVFEHALSWITLQVKTKDAAAEGVFTIKSVKINGVNTTADFEASMLDQEMVQYESWTNWGTPAEYVVFDGVQGVTAEPTVIENTAAGTLVIPQATTNVTVVFDQKGVNGTMDMKDMVVNLDLVLDQDNEPWRPGYHYIYTLVFGLDEILINPSVDLWNEYIVGELDPEAINVSTAAQLEAALANEEATKITFQADIEGDFTVPEVAGRTLIINGNGYKLNGSFFMNGKTAYAGATTVYENINFETADASTMTGDAFIYCGEGKGTNYRYPDGITVKNCTFKATGAAVENAVAVKLWALNGALSVENCTADGLHSFMQLTSCGKAVVEVENLTVANCKNGISLGNTGKTTISNSNIATREYGVRADGCQANTSIVNTTIEAKQPVIVRKVTVDGYVLNVDDKTTLTTVEDYQVIFTAKSDDVAYVAPTASFTFNGPATLKVFPKPAAWVETAEELAAALTADKENIAVVLSADIDLPIASLGQQTGGSGEYKLGGESTKTITIDLGGKTLNITTTYWSGIGAKNADAKIVIKNGTMTSSQATGTWNSYDLTFANCNYEIANVEFSKAIAFTNANKTVVLNDVTINETHDYYAMWISAKGQDVKINGLTINSTGRGIKIDEQYVDAPAKVTMKVENATFKTAKKAAILVKSAAGAAITLNNVDITATPDTANAVWVDADAAAYADKVTVTGGNVIVEP